jgi:PhnB protein
MARVNIYLTLAGNTEEAFNAYKSVFGGEFAAFQRMSEVPSGPDSPELPENERDKVMHVELPILGGASLMGSDLLESMGHSLTTGNNVAISLEPDDVPTAQRLFDGLSQGGSEVEPLQRMFWGAHYGSCTDRFGTRWLFNVPDTSG